jgi:hypothetical protein
MTPEQSEALARASVGLTSRIADLQKAIEDHDPVSKLEEQLAQARSLHQALSDVLSKSTDLDPKVQVACRKLGELLDGLERVMNAEDPQ